MIKISNTFIKEDFHMVSFDRFKDGKRYALTFSYDDGCAQDRRLVELFNKYGMKCTFNFYSKYLCNPESKGIHPEEVDRKSVV